MQLNKICKVQHIKLSKKLTSTIDNIEKKPKTNLKKYIVQPKIKENIPLVKIEMGPFIIHL